MDQYLAQTRAVAAQGEPSVLSENQQRLGVTRDILVSMKVAVAKSVEWVRSQMCQRTLHFSIHGWNKDTEYARVAEKFTLIAGKFYEGLHIGNVMLT